MEPTSYKYERFFELSPDLLCIAGFDGYFKKVNCAVTQLLGYDEEEMYARPINDFIHPDDQEITYRHRTELFNLKPLFNFENRYLKKSGEVVWLSWTSLPVETEQLIFGVAKDVTYKIQLETERNLMMTQLLQMNHDLKQLHYTTTHNLRSPINNFIGIVELLLMEKHSAATQELLVVLNQAGLNLKNTLEGYVDDLGMHENSKQGFEPVSVTETIHAVTNSIHELIRKSKAKINIQMPENTMFFGRKTYLHSIFLNLITNAIKYARPELPPIIDIEASAHQTNFVIKVSDNGQGFDVQANEGKLFGFQQKFHSHADSKGIGLFLVYHHVQRMNGQIQLESKLNEGTTFIMTFLNPN
ncbi:MAG: PAS domain-containing sensor histidine kinase [Sphingobacteriaceae bacterium]|nr:PAS domain-containing sensor histidine kinase [Sphingobacteriaceae bacterium]